MSRYGNRPSSTLYVRNISDRVRHEDLKRLFSKYGKVLDVTIPLDYYSRMPKGFCFVEYEDPRDSEEALYRLDRQRLFGREIEVEYARGDRKTPGEMRGRDRDRRGYGGGGGGRGYDRGYDDYDRHRSRSRDKRRRSRGPSYSRSKSRGSRSYSKGRSPSPPPRNNRHKSISRERSRSPHERSISRHKSPPPPPPQRRSPKAPDSNHSRSGSPMD